MFVLLRKCIGTNQQHLSWIHIWMQKYSMLQLRILILKITKLDLYFNCTETFLLSFCIFFCPVCSDMLLCPILYSRKIYYFQYGHCLKTHLKEWNKCYTINCTYNIENTTLVKVYLLTSPCHQISERF